MCVSVYSDNLTVSFRPIYDLANLFHIEITPNVAIKTKLSIEY